MADPLVELALLPARWTLGIAREISRAPATVRRARDVLDDLAALPDQIDALIGALDRTTTTIDDSLGELSQAVAGGMNDRLEHLDEVVSELNTTIGELGAVVTGVLGAVPGARRAVRAAQQVSANRVPAAGSSLSPGDATDPAVSLSPHLTDSTALGPSTEDH